MPTMTPVPSTPPTPVPSPAPTKSAVPSPEPTAWCKKDYYLYYTSGVLGYDSFVEFLQDPTTVADTNQTHMAEIDNGKSRMTNKITTVLRVHLICRAHGTHRAAS